MNPIRSPLAVGFSALLAACGGPMPESSADGAQDASAARGERAAEAPGHTVIPSAIAEASGIRVAAAGPATIADEHEMQGLLTLVEGRAAKVTARFPGVIRALRANVGDRVRAGQTLALIESNLSLSTYAIAAPLGGTVLERSASEGSVVAEAGPLYEIADLSELWVDLHVFGRDAEHILPGAVVTVTRLGDAATAGTAIERVLPTTATASQSTVARARLANRDGLWRPGSAVKARVTVARADVPLAVPVGALQSRGAGEVVYVREGETYRAREVALGRRDARHAEIVRGLAPGELVVVEQSYLVKADIEKSTVADDD